MTNILKIRKQMETFLTIAKVGLSYKEKLSESLDACGEKELFFLSFFLDGSIDNLPVSEDESVHVSKSLGKLLDIVHGINSGVNEFYDHKEVYSTLVSSDILRDDVIRIRCLKSVLRALDGGYPEIALPILESLEKISDQKLVFSGLSDEDTLLYRKIYVVLAVYYFSAVQDSSKIFILSNPFLVLALSLGLDLKETLASYVKSYNTVEFRRNASLDFAAALGQNKAMLGHDLDGGSVTVQWWTRKAVLIENKNLEKDLDFLANTFFWQSIISQVVDLYLALVAGEFIVDENILKKVDVMLEIVPQEQVANFSAWIEREDVRWRCKKWLDTFTSKHLATLGLVAYLSALDDNLLRNESNVASLLRLAHWLKDGGSIKDEDLIYFDDESGNFEWVKQ